MQKQTYSKKEQTRNKEPDGIIKELIMNDNTEKEKTLAFSSNYFSRPSNSIFFALSTPPSIYSPPSFPSPFPLSL